MYHKIWMPLYFTAMHKPEKNVYSAEFWASFNIYIYIYYGIATLVFEMYIIDMPIYILSSFYDYVIWLYNFFYYNLLTHSFSLLYTFTINYKQMSIGWSIWSTLQGQGRWFTISSWFFGLDRDRFFHSEIWRSSEYWKGCMEW